MLAKLISAINQIKINNLLVYGFILLLPTQLGRHFFFDFSYINGVRIDYLSIIVHLTDLIFLALVVFNFADIKKTLLQNKNLVYIFLSLIFLNLVIALHPIVALYKAIKIAQIVILVIIFYKQRKNIPDLTLPFLIGAIVQLLLCLYQLINRSSLQGVAYLFGERYLNMSHPGVSKAVAGGVEFLRPYGTFSHPNSLAGFYLLIYFYFLTNHKAQKINLTTILLLVVSSGLVFITFSKTAIITYLVLNFVYFFKRFNTTCKPCLIGRFLIMTILGAFFLTIQTDPLTIVKRLTLISHALQIIKDHLLFGVGLGHYLYFEAKQPFAFSYFSLQPVHNIFLLVLSEVGVLTSTVLALAFGIYLKSRIVRPVVLFCLLVVVITGSADHYWVTLQQNWLLLGVIFGLIL